MQKPLFFLILFVLLLPINANADGISVFNNGCQASITPFSCTSGANINLDSRDLGNCTYASGFHCANINSVFTFTDHVSKNCNYNLDFTKGIVDVALKDNNATNAAVFLDSNCNTKVCYDGLCK